MKGFNPGPILDVENLHINDKLFESSMEGLRDVARVRITHFISWQTSRIIAGISDSL